MQNITIPTKGRGRVALKEATTQELQNFVTWQTKQFDEGKVKEQFAAVNKRQLAEAEREIARRRSGESSEPQPAAVVQHEVRREVQSLGKAIRDPQAVTKFLSELAQNYHLVGPATSVDMLPEGFGVAVSYVQVNPDDCYDVGNGKLALPNNELKRIAVAAGLTWDTERSGRIDNGRDPHLAAYRAVGSYRAFDGTVLTVSGSVEIDMRDGSPQLEALRAAAVRRNAKDNGDGEIMMIRKFIVRHAETKAKLRAIADMGIRRAYAAQELSKPFAISRLTWTGETEDVGLRREFARMFADNFFASSRVLYGAAAATPVRQLPAPKPEAIYDDQFDDFEAFGEGMEDVA